MVRSPAGIWSRLAAVWFLIAWRDFSRLLIDRLIPPRKKTFYEDVTRSPFDSPGVPASTMIISRWKKKERKGKNRSRASKSLEFWIFDSLLKIMSWWSIFENLNFHHISFDRVSRSTVFNPLPKGTRFKYCDQILREEKKGKKRKEKRIFYSSGIFFWEKVTCADIDISSSTWFLLWTALKFSQAEADNGTNTWYVRALCTFPLSWVFW